MALISLKWFSGMVPRAGEQHLPPPYATDATNTNLYSGELRPLRKPSLAHQFPAPGDSDFHKPVAPDPGKPAEPPIPWEPDPPPNPDNPDPPDNPDLPNPDPDKPPPDNPDPDPDPDPDLDPELWCPPIPELCVSPCRNPPQVCLPIPTNCVGVEILTAPSNQNVAVGDPVSLTLGLNTASSPIYIFWYRNGTYLTGEDGATLSFIAEAGNFSYYALVSNPCGQAHSGTITVTAT